MLSRLLRASTSLAAFPAVLAHEATHAALSAPHSDSWTLRASPTRGSAAVIVDSWDVGTPRWAIVLAHLGPLLCGLLLATLGLSYVAIYGYSPETTYDWLKISILAMWWGIYTTPSGGDLAILQGGEHETE